MTQASQTSTLRPSARRHRARLQVSHLPARLSAPYLPHACPRCGASRVKMVELARRRGRRRGSLVRAPRSYAARFSTTVAIPCPTPMHIVASPCRAPRRPISCSSVVRIRAPEQPSGWPSAIAPPLRLTRSGSRPSSRMQASDCDANASLSSVRSRSATVSPARASALRLAGIGPRPMQAGSTPATAVETIRAIG